MRRALAIAVLSVACRAHASDAPAALEQYSAGAHATDKLPLVVALHGWGGSPENVARLLYKLDVKARVYAPHGATPVGDGWGWFPRRGSRASDETAQAMTDAAATLAQAITAEAQLRPTCGKPIVVGFSQGAFLSYALAAQPKPVIALALPISGFLPASIRPQTHPADAPRVLAFHGDSDGVVDVAWDRDTNAQFVTAGYKAELKVYQGLGHSTTPDETDAVRDAIAAQIRASGCAK